MHSVLLLWRKFKQRRFTRKKRRYESKFAKCGDNLLIYGKPQISFPQNIMIGNNVNINNGAVLNATCSHIEIGDNVTISSNAKIIAASYDVESFLFNGDRTHISNTIKIGSNVWIGCGATIVPGVTICDRVVIGAGAVVTRDINDRFSLVAGNPARAVKKYDVK